MILIKRTRALNDHKNRISKESATIPLKTKPTPADALVIIDSNERTVVLFRLSILLFT